jgi:midasin
MFIQLSNNIDDAETTVASIEEAIRKLKILVQKSNDTTDRRLSLLMSFQKELQILHSQWKSLFVWQDGPLVEAMRKGDLFLVDEISLADDSVLERLNSVLEPKRVLVSINI